jgi:hypothetical protein
MTSAEKLLLQLIEMADSRNEQAIILQTYIQKEGPLSEAAASEVRKILGKKLNKGD